LEDIYKAILQLGDAVGEPFRAKETVRQLRKRLDAIAARAPTSRVRALIVIDDAGRGVVGRNNYLDDLLRLAGGENVIRATSAAYPSIDPELLVALNPDVIFQLLPGAPPQVRAQAQRFWQSLPQLAAVREGRVHILTEPYVLLPGVRVVDVADRFERGLRLNPAPTSAPVAKGAP
jgi:iron complex transport system substrate-binding protein